MVAISFNDMFFFYSIAITKKLYRYKQFVQSSVIQFYIKLLQINSP